MIHDYDQQGQIGSFYLRLQLHGILLFDLHEFTDDVVGEWGISRALFLSLVFWGMMGILWGQIPNLPLFAFQWLIGTAPVWLPVAALVTAWKTWVWYVRSNYIFKRDTMVLEVKMPRDITRSPRAMENALSTLWTDSGETTFYNRVWQGQCRPYFSFEVASFGGQLHFYIWCWRGWRDTVEAAMYAFYPEVELVEVEDYASKFKYDPEIMDAFPTDWRYEPRNDAYPIRTYVDFELDQNPEEEFKVDPLAMVLERMSGIHKDEQMWYQIIITQCRDVDPQPGHLFGFQDRYTSLLKNEITAIRKETVGDPDDPTQRWMSSARVPNFRHAELVKIIDRNLGKLPFNVGMRGVYIASSKQFNASGYTALRWLWRPVANIGWANQMRPRRGGNPFDWPWQDFNDFRWHLMVRRWFDCYRRRSHFYPPWVYPHHRRSTEVIATMWHPPAASATLPGLERIPAKKAEPPANLPK